MPRWLPLGRPVRLGLGCLRRQRPVPPKVDVGPGVVYTLGRAIRRQTGVVIPPQPHAILASTTTPLPSTTTPDIPDHTPTFRLFPHTSPASANPLNNALSCHSTPAPSLPIAHPAYGPSTRSDLSIFHRKLPRCLRRNST